MGDMAFIRVTNFLILAFISCLINVHGEDFSKQNAENLSNKQTPGQSSIPAFKNVDRLVGVLENTIHNKFGSQSPPNSKLDSQGNLKGFGSQKPKGDNGELLFDEGDENEFLEDPDLDFFEDDLLDHDDKVVDEKDAKQAHPPKKRKRREFCKLKTERPRRFPIKDCFPLKKLIVTRCVGRCSSRAITGVYPNEFFHYCRCCKAVGYRVQKTVLKCSWKRYKAYFHSFVSDCQCTQCKGTINHCTADKGDDCNKGGSATVTDGTVPEMAGPQVGTTDGNTDNTGNTGNTGNDGQNDAADPAAGAEGQNVGDVNDTDQDIGVMATDDGVEPQGDGGKK